MAEQKIHLGKFINNLDSEDLSSEKLQGVVNNVYAKAVSTHKKKAKEVEEETKEQEEDTVTFIKSNHDRLKAHKNKPEKDIDKDDATAKNKIAKEINESVEDEIKKKQQKMHKIANRLDKMVAKDPNVEHTNAFKRLESEMESLAFEIEELKSKGIVNESVEDEFEVARYNGNQYGIWSKTSKNWMTFGRKKDLEKRVKELNANNPNKKLKESEEGITPDNIYDALIKKLPTEDIDHHESDLYVRKTPKSTEIINKLTNKSLLSTFKDNIDGDIWYELPFCYTPFFGESKELTETVKSNLFQPSVDPWERDTIDTSAWVKGTISKDGAEYQVSAKVFNEPSQYGINHGRISKLWVKEKGYPVAINYDRGWVDAPPHNEDLLNTVIKELEDYRDKHPISVNESKQIPESKKLTETSVPRNASKIKVGGREFTKNDKYWSYDDKDSLTGKVNVSPKDIKRLYGNDVEVLETDPNYKPKRTKEVKVLQGNYGYGWDDLVEYDKEDSAELKQDLKSYRENERNAQFRVVTRRVPLGEDKLTESHNLKRNITNIKFAVKELQKKGYSHEEANDLVLKIFDEHEGDTNRSLEWYLDKVLSKADYNKEYGITEGKEKKIDLYVNGEYVCSSTRYKRVKDFVDAVKKDGKVTYAGLDNNGKLSDKVTKTIKDTDEVVGRIVTESKKLTEAKSAKKFIYNLDGRFVAHQLIGVDSKFNRPFDLAKKYRDITNDPSFKKGSIGAKHKSYRNAVNEWVKTVEPTEFIVYTKEESPSWKDDSLDVYYRKETINESKKLTEAEDESFIKEDASDERRLEDIKKTLENGKVIKISKRGFTPTKFCLKDGKIWYYNKEISIGGWNKHPEFDLDKFAQHATKLQDDGFIITVEDEFPTNFYEPLKEAFPTDNELNEAFKLDELQLNKFVRLVEVGKITKDEFLDAVGRLIDENSSDLKQLLRKPDENVKKWYKENYPTDPLGDNINPNLTFGELIKGINKHKDFYDLIGVGDSLVRERLFNWIAKICGVSYDTVYNKWLGESVKTKDTPHKKLMEESEGGPSLSGFKSEELDDIFKVGAKFTLKKPMELEVFIPDDWRYDWSEDGFTDKELEEIGRDFRQELEDLEQYDTKILDKYIVLDKLEGAKLELPAGFELTVAENIPNTQWFNGNPWFTEVVFDTKDGQIRQFYNSVPGPTFIAHNS